MVDGLETLASQRVWHGPKVVGQGFSGRGDLSRKVLYVGNVAHSHRSASTADGANIVVISTRTLATQKLLHLRCRKARFNGTGVGPPDGPGNGG